MSASNQVKPSGDYNNIGTVYLTPKTGTTITVCAAADGSDEYITLDGTNLSLNLDNIRERTGGAGVTFHHFIKIDEIREKTSSAAVKFTNGIKTADIKEASASGGINFRSDGDFKWFTNAGFLHWEIDAATGAFIPGGGQNLGSSASRVYDGFIDNLYAEKVIADADHLVLSAATAKSVYLAINLTNKWAAPTAAGDIEPVTDNAFNIGADAKRVKHIKAVAVTASNYYLASKPDYAISNLTELRNLDCTAISSGASLATVIDQLNYVKRVLGTIGVDLTTIGFFQ